MRPLELIASMLNHPKIAKWHREGLIDKLAVEGDDLVIKVADHIHQEFMAVAQGVMEEMGVECRGVEVS